MLKMNCVTPNMTRPNVLLIEKGEVDETGGEKDGCTTPGQYNKELRPYMSALV